MDIDIYTQSKCCFLTRELEWKRFIRIQQFHKLFEKSVENHQHIPCECMYESVFVTLDGVIYEY